MRKILFLLCALLGGAFLRPASAQVTDDGNWTLHLSYRNATRCATAGDWVYVLMNGNLSARHLRTDEVRYFSPQDGLGSKGIVDIAYSAECKCLVAVYEDFQVDLICDEGRTIVGLPGLKNMGSSVGTPVSLSVGGDYAAIASSTGMAYLNLRNRTVNGFFDFGQKIYAAAVWQNRLFISTATHIRTCSLEANPYDLSSWTTICSARVGNFCCFAGRLYAAINAQPTAECLGAGLWLMREDASGFDRLTKLTVNFIRTTPTRVVGGNAAHLFMLTADNPTQPDFSINYANNWGDCTPVGNSGEVWAADKWNGVGSYRVTAESVEAQELTWEGIGPKRDYCYFMHYEGDRLLVAGGNLFTYGGDLPATLMYLEGEDWYFLQEDGVKGSDGVPYYNDATGLTVDPKDPTHLFATSKCGLFEFRDLQYVECYNLRNSPLQSALASGRVEKYIFLSTPTFDKDGNLWMINSMVDTVLCVRKADGTWSKIYVDAVKAAPTCEHLLFDAKGRLWMTSRRSVSYIDGGTLCLDYNGTIDNTADDVARYRTSLVNQDGTTITNIPTYDIAEDRDGSIWLATASGVFQVENPDDWFDSNLTVIQPKVPRNDGTNYADYLLGGTVVSAIAIDGGGRKWLGTTTSGVYLTSPDGSEIIAHFDTSNSLILSDNVYAIAIHPVTGEVMIATDRGLCAYRGDATAPAETLEKSQVRVYPNPVRPEYRGVVTVAGLTDAADVKVMTAGGQVVAGGTSVGGSFTWDCCGPDGSRVGAGVYFFMLSTADGNKGIVAKVVVI